jgi:hypothetical protein
LLARLSAERERGVLAAFVVTVVRLGLVVAALQFVHLFIFVGERVTIALGLRPGAPVDFLALLARLL